MEPQRFHGNGIGTEYLGRLACIYVRQSTMQQVRDNCTSAERQYELKLRALDLGWREDQVVIIDDDQAKSGAYADGRDAYTTLLQDISLERIGALFGSEISRISRDSSDWQLLIKLCNCFNTLIIDEHRVFDPHDENDRLCLGIKGMLAEMELALITDRLAEGRIRRAREGKLRRSLPIGLVYDAQKNVILDPDQEVQNSVRWVLGCMDRFSSLREAVTHFNEQKMLFPSRPPSGPGKGVLRWVPLEYDRALQVLDKPAYAGTYTYGRSKRQANFSFDGMVRVRRSIVRVEMENWKVILHDAHEGYITWDQYLHNRQRLADNRYTPSPKARGAVRSGSALLQGVIFCGNCGHKMKVEYPSVAKHPFYVCQGRRRSEREKRCLTVAAPPLDEAITDRVLQAYQPAQLQALIETFHQLTAQAREHERRWQMRLEGAEYEVDLAYRQFNQVDPCNRLVAASLERKWNEKLVEAERLKKEWASLRDNLPPPLSAAERQAVMSLAEDILLVWRRPSTTNEERKQLLRLMIKDITILKESCKSKYSVRAGLRWQGGARTELYFSPFPQTGRAKTHPDVIALIRRLAAGCDDREIAERLNAAGLKSRNNREFNFSIVRQLRYRFNIQRFAEPAVAAAGYGDGWYSVSAASQLLNASAATIRLWIKTGTLKGVKIPPNNWRVEITQEDLKLKKSRPGERTNKRGRNWHPA